MLILGLSTSGVCYDSSSQILTQTVSLFLLHCAKAYSLNTSLKLWHVLMCCSERFCVELIWMREMVADSAWYKNIVQVWYSVTGPQVRHFKIYAMKFDITVKLLHLQHTFSPPPRHIRTPLLPFTLTALTNQLSPTPTRAIIYTPFISSTPHFSCV